MKILQNKFIKNISLLVGGTAIGQIIAVITLPLLTRLYSPDSFSILAVYVAALTLISVISCLCFEYAIPLPKNKVTAAALVVLSLISVIVITLLVCVIIMFFPSWINSLTENKINEFLWLLPLGVFAIGLYNALQYWNTREKNFTLISKTRITQSLSGTLVKLGVGAVSSGWPGGLVIGQLIAQSAGFFSFISVLLKNDLHIFRKVKSKHLRLAVKRYEKFPKFTTLEVFANAAGIQLPMLLIAYYAVGAEAGFLMIAMQLLSAPMGMISGAVAQVYLADAADKHHQGQLSGFTKKIILNLLKVSIAPLSLVLLCAPILTPYVLGDNWARTGVLICWMVPWFLMQFITSPVSTSLYITNNQQLAFFLQLFGLVLRVGCVWLAGVFANQYIAEFYAVSGLIFYLIYLLVVLKVLKNIDYKEVSNNDN
ncbi:lipopolysaccharide biosynthesis protein [Alcaligenes endophyticus]|uniref:Oligosaccharide flippase family protein n=1 Tax=Alcaligenes endophyticus TaxID=1929088 RepID=A0ABT8EFR2_9BURK|nr:oligosaccharide flippase family protein [Alcaligenes endophyticus]MCX5590193.1 oligosaccharide flippase family protein [Alcaligenes endophyticus]MDN4120144.1 oligosaccharide flippase family protein [Alcaligenes endophyticus]